MKVAPFFATKATSVSRARDRLAERGFARLRYVSPTRRVAPHVSWSVPKKGACSTGDEIVPISVLASWLVGGTYFSSSPQHWNEHFKCGRTQGTN